MSQFDMLETVFIIWAMLLQLALALYFAFRKWAYAAALRHGWIIYAGGLPALFISLWLWFDGRDWYLWSAGLIFAGWTLLGFLVDWAWRIPWRSPIYWPVFAPYVLLYLAGQGFYWWGVGLLSRPLWFVYAALFFVSMLLNITSHRQPEQA